MNPPPARTRRKRPDGQQTRAAPARRGRGPRGRAGLRRRAAGRLGAGAVTGGSSAPLAAGPHAGLAAPTGRFSLTPQESRCRGSVRNDPGLEWRGLGRRGPATGPQGARPRALPGVPAAGDWGLARDARSSGDPPVRRVKCPYPQKEQLCRGCRGAAAGGAGTGLSPGGPHSSASHAHPQTAGKQRGAPRSPLVARGGAKGPGWPGPARPARKTQGGTGPGTALRRQPREEGSQRAPEASSARTRLRQVGTQGVAGSWRVTQPRAQRARAAGDTGDSHVWVVQGQTAAGGRAGGRSSPSEQRRSAPPGTAPWRAWKWRWRQWSLDWENFANQTTAENAAGVPVTVFDAGGTRALGPGGLPPSGSGLWPSALRPPSPPAGAPLEGNGSPQRAADRRRLLPAAGAPPLSGGGARNAKK